MGRAALQRKISWHRPTAPDRDSDRKRTHDCPRVSAAVQWTPGLEHQPAQNPGIIGCRLAGTIAAMTFGLLILVCIAQLRIGGLLVSVRGSWEYPESCVDPACLQPHGDAACTRQNGTLVLPASDCCRSRLQHRQAKYRWMSAECRSAPSPQLPSMLHHKSIRLRMRRQKESRRTTIVAGVQAPAAQVTLFWQTMPRARWTARRPPSKPQQAQHRRQPSRAIAGNHWFRARSGKSAAPRGLVCSGDLRPLQWPPMSTDTSTERVPGIVLERSAPAGQ